MKLSIVESIEEQEATPPRGISLQTWQAILAVGAIVKSARAEAREDFKVLRGILANLSDKVADLDVKLLRRTLPPPRPPVDSVVDVQIIKERVKEAVTRGEQSPTSTPAKEVDEELDAMAIEWAKRRGWSWAKKVLFWAIGVASGGIGKAIVDHLMAHR